MIGYAAVSRRLERLKVSGAMFVHADLDAKAAAAPRSSRPRGASPAYRGGLRGRVTNLAGGFLRVEFAVLHHRRPPGVPLIVIQRQLGHSNLGITSIYLQGIDNAEIIEAVHARRVPMVPRQHFAPTLTLAVGSRALR
jgi:integrase